MSFMLLVMLMVAGVQQEDVSAKEKTKKITINLRGGNTAIREPMMVLKAEKGESKE